jgi:hypothetical protein
VFLAMNSGANHPACPWIQSSSIQVTVSNSGGLAGECPRRDLVSLLATHKIEPEPKKSGIFGAPCPINQGLAPPLLHHPEPTGIFRGRNLLVRVIQPTTRVHRICETFAPSRCDSLHPSITWICGWTVSTTDGG